MIGGQGPKQRQEVEVNAIIRGSVAGGLVQGDGSGCGGKRSDSGWIVEVSQQDELMDKRGGM